jgi:hypothetical protein
MLANAISMVDFPIATLDFPFSTVDFAISGLSNGAEFAFTEANSLRKSP